MKTFKDLREATGDIVKNIIQPADLRSIRELTTSLTATPQSTIVNVLEKIEAKLQFSGYTLGELDLEDIEDEGSEDYFILTNADQEIVRNAYITLEWEKVDSMTSFAHTPDGAKLRLDVLVTLHELAPEEMDEIIANSLSGEEKTGEEEDLSPNDGDRASEVEPDDMNEEVLTEAAIRIKKISRTLLITVGTDTVISLTVLADGTINLCDNVVPKQHAETVINALMEHYIEKTEK